MKFANATQIFFPCTLALQSPGPLDDNDDAGEVHVLWSILFTAFHAAMEFCTFSLLG